MQITNKVFTYPEGRDKVVNSLAAFWSLQLIDRLDLCNVHVLVEGGSSHGIFASLKKYTYLLDNVSHHL